MQRCATCAIASSSFFNVLSGSSRKCVHGKQLERKSYACWHQKACIVRLPAHSSDIHLVLYRPCCRKDTERFSATMTYVSVERAHVAEMTATLDMAMVLQSSRDWNRIQAPQTRIGSDVTKHAGQHAVEVCDGAPDSISSSTVQS